MDENEIYEAMGLEAPAAEETTESPEGDAGEVAEEQPPQEGAGEGEEAQGEEPLAEAEPPHPSPATPTPPSTQGEGNVSEEARQAEIDRVYAAAYAGRLNPYTGRPITSKAEFEAYQAQFQADQQRARVEQMRKAGVDPEAIQSIIDQHPVVQQAQQVIQQAQAERERAQKEQAKGWYGEQLKQINALDPEAKLGSLDELAARDPAQYGKMLGMVAGGVSLADAYKALNFDALAQKRAAAAKRAAINQTAGKAHLAPSAGQGKAGVEVPGSIREMYRDLGLEMSDAEISRDYAEYMKQMGQ